MISIKIPGYGDINLEHAVFDYNGTLALDGIVLPAVAENMQMLSKSLALHVVTADTFGRVEDQLQSLPVRIHILKAGREAEQKAAYVQDLQPEKVVAIGNGNNDCDMLRLAGIGMMVIGGECGSGRAVGCADIVARNIDDVFGMLLHPQRIKATLRF
jgi:soluble P-type ATPase